MKSLKDRKSSFELKSMFTIMDILENLPEKEAQETMKAISNFLAGLNGINKRRTISNQSQSPTKHKTLAQWQSETKRKQIIKK